jgi:hypothetical protein
MRKSKIGSGIFSGKRFYEERWDYEIRCDLTVIDLGGCFSVRLPLVSPPQQLLERLLFAVTHSRLCSGFFAKPEQATLQLRRTLT